MSNGIAGERLRSFIERYERLDGERKAIADDQKEVLAEAKSEGFDVSILRKIIARRKMDANKRQEQDEILSLYEDAIGPQGRLEL